MKGSNYQKLVFMQIWPTMCLFSVPQKDDEITKLRKELESRKPRARAANTQKSSALEQVRNILFQALEF